MRTGPFVYQNRELEVPGKLLIKLASLLESSIVQKSDLLAERKTKVLQVSTADGGGGANRAAARVHTALQLIEQESGVESHQLVARRLTGSRGAANLLERSWTHRQFMNVARRIVDQQGLLSGSSNSVFRSPATLRTTALRRIEQLNPDIVVLHWLGSRMMSIRQMGQIERPTAWVLHDAWTFSGAEHYPHGETDHRFIDGYHKNNRLDGEWGIDLNRLVWQQKRRYWERPIHLIAPSSWMALQASRSAIARDWPVTVIPNPLDTEWWGAMTRLEARRRLGLSQDSIVLLYGALRGDRNFLKGADLLDNALTQVPVRHGLNRNGSLKVLAFGGEPGTRRVGLHEIQSVGHLDDEGLRSYYSAADVMIVPSRIDNLPQTAVEAMTCGTPVVAFRTGGLPDIVQDRVNGRLAAPFSPESLATSISWVLETPERHGRLSEAARTSSSRWAPDRIAKRYVELFKEILSRRLGANSASERPM